MKSVKFVLSIGCLIFANAILAQVAEIKSPDQKIQLQVHENNGKVSYDIHYAEAQFLEDSPLGLKTSLGDFSSQLKFISAEVNTIENSYDLDRAKVSHVDYKATELVSKFINEHQDSLFVYFRVSNRDVAYSYTLKSKAGRSNVKIFEEASGFNLPDYATTYITPQALPMTGWMETKPSYEEEYTLGEKLGEPSTYGVGYTFPALFKLGENGWVLISETGVDGGYPGSRLSESTQDGVFTVEFPQEGENNSIGDAFAAMAMPAKTPWRTITLGESLKPIVESTVAFDLVEPKYKPTIDYKMGRAAWSWIVWQDNSINYDDQIKYIDMASSLGFEYVLIDNWWDNNIGHKRMEKLVKYARSKNVEVLLWYNSNGYWNEAPQTPQDKMNTSIARKKEMEWLQKIGVKGLKIDFFGGDKQTTMKLYEDILTDANDYGLGITFHGCTLPRGWQKMYPNYVTSEAVLASENLIFRQDALDKHALNSTILPFIRNAVGAMDFAPVFLNQKMSREQKNGTIRSTTDAFELATSVLYFSPIQHFGLTPNNLEEQPDHVLDFIKEVPTVWDETIYIGGEPEDYCALARRKGDRWYVAVSNATKEQRKIALELPMLAGKEVKHLYDNKDKTAGYKTSKIRSNGTLEIELLPEGGAVLYEL